MLIKEYRVTLPLTVEEYQVAQLYSVAEVSKNETGGGEGIEVLKNEPFKDFPLLGELEALHSLLMSHQTMTASLCLTRDLPIKKPISSVNFFHNS